jgi:hypothetical protein
MEGDYAQNRPSLPSAPRAGGSSSAQVEQLGLPCSRMQPSREGRSEQIQINAFKRQISASKR